MSTHFKHSQGTINSISLTGKSVAPRWPQLGEKYVIMTKYPIEKQTQFLYGVLREYDEIYDPTIRSKGRQSKMKRIDKVLGCQKHTKSSPYGLEFMLCVKKRCKLCPHMLRVFKLTTMHSKEDSRIQCRRILAY